ncbi:MAG TPA: TonB family protein [Pyrinomonadaceae bacterium]
MLKSNLPKLALLVLSIVFLSVVTAFAQRASCALEVETELKNGILIKGARASAVNVKSKRLYRSVMRNGTPYFAKLPEGRYNLTVTKPGFKQSKDSYVVVCADAEDGVLSALVPMVKGSPRQIYAVQQAGTRWIVGTRLGSENINPPPRTENLPVTGNDELPPPPKPTQTPRRVPKIISKGVVNASAVILPKPNYPPAAKAVRAAGTVPVQVTIDENGNVISASAAGGHPLLQQAAVGAARQAKFRPTLLSGTPVKVTGIIVYNFVAQ